VGKFVRIVKNKNEEQLIEMMKNGNEAAFDELMCRCGPYIKSWIFKFCKDNDRMVEEIYSLTLVKAWEKISTFKGDSGFKTWACSIARRNFLDEYRRNKKANFVDIEMCLNLSPRPLNDNDLAFLVEVSPEFELYDAVLPSNPLEKREELKKTKLLLQKILTKLKPNDREILKLYYKDTAQYKDIAKELGIPVGTVMSRLFYARKNAAKVIKRLKYKL